MTTVTRWCADAWSFYKAGKVHENYTAQQLKYFFDNGKISTATVVWSSERWNLLHETDSAFGGVRMTAGELFT